MKRGSALNRNLDRRIGIPVLFVVGCLNRSRSRPATVEHIGITASAALGDTLLTSAVIQDIRKHFAKACISFFAAPSNAAAAKLLPGLDRVEKIRLTRPLEAIASLRRARLDVLFDFWSWPRVPAIYTTLSGARYRVGFDTPGQHRHWGYDLTAKHSSTVHELENYRRLVRAYGIEAGSPPSLIVPQRDVPFLNGASRLIVFHPWAGGTGRHLREWPESRWIQLARRLDRADTLFVITGAVYELSRSEDLRDRMKEAGVSALAYKSADGLISLANLLASSALVVSVNTGIMHLAAILGAPTVGLNGPSAELRWGPRGSCAASVASRGHGCGFLHLGFEYDGNPTDCMERILVDDVVETATEVELRGVSRTRSRKYSEGTPNICSRP